MPRASPAPPVPTRRRRRPPRSGRASPRSRRSRRSPRPPSRPAGRASLHQRERLVGRRTDRVRARRPRAAGGGAERVRRAGRGSRRGRLVAAAVAPRAGSTRDRAKALGGSIAERDRLLDLEVERRRAHPGRRDRTRSGRASRTAGAAPRGATARPRESGAARKPSRARLRERERRRRAAGARVAAASARERARPRAACSRPRHAGHGRPARGSPSSRNASARRLGAPDREAERGRLRATAASAARMRPSYGVEQVGSNRGGRLLRRQPAGCERPRVRAWRPRRVVRIASAAGTRARATTLVPPSASPRRGGGNRTVECQPGAASSTPLRGAAARAISSSCDAAAVAPRPERRARRAMLGDVPRGASRPRSRLRPRAPRASTASPSTSADSASESASRRVESLHATAPASPAAAAAASASAAAATARSSARRTHY